MPGAKMSQQRQQLRRAPPERVVIDDEQQELRPGERADDDPDAEVHHPGGVETARPRPRQRELQPQQVCRGKQHAVGVDGKAADLKEDGMHVVALRRAFRAAP